MSYIQTKIRSAWMEKRDLNLILNRILISIFCAVSIISVTCLRLKKSLWIWQVDFAVNNSKVGKIHAEIVLKDGNCCIKDLNSKNGTYLNGSADRIASNIPYPLTNGTKIALADSEFVYHC